MSSPPVQPVLPLLNAAPAARAPEAPRGWPLLRLGFRPFYLGAAAFAAIAVPLWVALVLGQAAPTLTLPPLLWHAHEMLFGFVAAVIVGFLLTAGRAWTGLATPRGAALGALVVLWLAARLAGLGAPYAVYATLDLALLPLAAAVLLRVLLRAGNRRNLPVAALLAGLALANAAFHAAALGLTDFAPMAALHAALALVVMIVGVIAGRVVPAFTQNAIPGLKLAARPRLDTALLGWTALALALWLFAPAGPFDAAALALAAVGHAWRLGSWQPWATRRRPILWILHLSYAWLPLGLALLALAQAGWIGVSAGVHALAVGAVAGLIVGMITRTARGHTGRPLQASRAEVAAYALVMAAAVLRVVAPLLLPSALTAWLWLAALAFGAAFVIYLVVFTPWLLATRLDGKDG